MNPVVRLFRLIVEGRRVRPADDESPYGAPGIFREDVDFIVNERLQRKHDDLMEAVDAAEKGRKGKR